MITATSNFSFDTLSSAKSANNTTPLSNLNAEVQVTLDLTSLVKAVVFTTWKNIHPASSFPVYRTQSPRLILKSHFKGVALLPDLNTLAFRETDVSDTLLNFVADDLSHRVTAFHSMDCSFTLGKPICPPFPNVVKFIPSGRNIAQRVTPDSGLGLFDTTKVKDTIFHHPLHLSSLKSRKQDFATLEYLSLYAPFGPLWVWESMLPDLFESLAGLWLKSLELSGHISKIRQPAVQSFTLSLQRLTCQQQQSRETI